jgi:hypothetical protein
VSPRCHERPSGGPDERRHAFGRVVQVSDGCSRQLDLRHVLELIERDRLSRRGLGEAELCASPGAIDPVEQGDNVRRVGIEVIDRATQKRPRQRAFVDVDPRSESGELGGVLAVERDVQALTLMSGGCTSRRVACTKRSLVDSGDNARGSYSDSGRLPRLSEAARRSHRATK